MAETNKMKKSMTEQQKQAVIEQLWLLYFNDTLWANGILSDEQLNRMRLMIKSRHSAKTR